MSWLGRKQPAERERPNFEISAPKLNWLTVDTSGRRRHPSEPSSDVSETPGGSAVLWSVPTIMVEFGITVDWLEHMMMHESLNEQEARVTEAQRRWHRAEAECILLSGGDVKTLGDAKARAHQAYSVALNESIKLAKMVKEVRGDE